MKFAGSSLRFSAKKGLFFLCFFPWFPYIHPFEPFMCYILMDLKLPICWILMVWHPSSLSINGRIGRGTKRGAWSASGGALRGRERTSLRRFHGEFSELTFFEHQIMDRLAGWWSGTFFIFPYIGKNHPNWLIFFRGVQTTNQLGFDWWIILVVSE